MRFQTLPGFRDFYPADLARRRVVESAWHAASRAAGFEEWDGPVLEPLELFTTKSGGEIAGQLYGFVDRGGREVALRPELTPSLARVVSARAGGLPKPIKWYCVAQFFRYERPQRGRGREFYQWNVDVVGAAEPAADAEVIAVALDALARLGLSARDVVVRLSDRRLAQRLLAGLGVEAELAAVLGAIDKLGRAPDANERLDQLVGAARAKEILSWCEHFPLEQADEIAPVLAACEDFGLADFVEPDFKIVRGLAYYTGPVWEIFDRSGTLRSVAGGGRYDHLLAAFGGSDLPALGFGSGDMVTMELLEAKRLWPAVPPRVDAFVLAIGSEMAGPARRVLRALRAAGVAADGPYAPVSGARVAKALRAAASARARHAVLVGPDEWAQGEVKLKDLASRQERAVRVEFLPDVLAS